MARNAEFYKGSKKKRSHYYVPVALAVARKGIPVRLLIDRARDAPLGIVPRNPGVIPTALGGVKQVCIGPELRQVAVLPDHDDVITLVTLRRDTEIHYMERIAPVGMGETHLDA